MAAGLAALLISAAALLFWRRVTVQLAPLETTALLAVAISTAAAGIAGRGAWSLQRPGHTGGRLDWLVPGLLSVAVLSTAVALSLPETSPGGLFILWGILAAEELWAWRPAVWRPMRFRLPGPRTLDDFRVDPPQTSAPHPIPDAPSSHQPPDTDVLQQLTRSRSASGGETISGWLRVPLVAGQRNSNVHVAFCPPFARTPAVSVQQLEGPQARVKTVQLLPFGARFDLKLQQQADAPTAVLLRFSAQSDPPAKAADA
jgi:hypothetical protein